MQVAKNQNIADRILWYWATLYSKSIKEGNNYIKTKKTIGILIADFELTNLNKIPKFHTSWHIREDEFSEIILTGKLEIHIIELKKLEVNKNQKLKQKNLLNWLKFILNPVEMEDSQMDDNIKEAKKVLEQISQDEKEQEKARLREKYIWEINSSRYDGYIEGKEAGRKEAMAEIELKIKEEKLKNAQKMLDKNMDINIIMEITGLTKKEIEKLLK